MLIRHLIKDEVTIECSLTGRGTGPRWRTQLASDRRRRPAVSAAWCHCITYELRPGRQGHLPHRVLVDSWCIWATTLLLARWADITDIAPSVQESHCAYHVLSASMHQLSLILCKQRTNTIVFIYPDSKFCYERRLVSKLASYIRAFGFRLEPPQERNTTNVFRGCHNGGSGCRNTNYKE